MNKRKPARAKPDKIIGCRFDSEQSAKLNRIADAHGVSVSVVLRWAVKQFKDVTLPGSK